MHIDLATLQEATGGQLYGQTAATTFESICLHARSAQPQSLYLAVEEPQQASMAAAVERGVAGILCEQSPTCDTQGVTVVLVGDVIQAAQAWVSHILRARSIVCMVILGASDGGLACRAVTDVLHDLSHAQALVLDSFDTLTLLRHFDLSDQTKLIVVDLPIGGRLHQQGLLTALLPQVCIFMAGQPIPSGLIEQCATVMPANGAFVCEAGVTLPQNTTFPRWSFSIDGTQADLMVTPQAYHLGHTRLTVAVPDNRSFELATSLVGASGVRATAAAIITGLLLDVPDRAIQSILNTISPPSGRLDAQTGQGQSLIYTLTAGAPHRPDDVSWFERAQGDYSKRLVILDQPDAVTNAENIEWHADTIIACSALTHQKWPRDARLYARPADLRDTLAPHLTPDAAVLVVGDHRTMPLVERLTGSSSPSKRAPSGGINVDLDAFAHNIHFARNRTDDAKFLLELPVDAYGCGLLPLAITAIDQGIEQIAVASLEEALTLVDALPPHSLMINGRLAPADIPRAAEKDIDLTVTSRSFLQQVITFSERYNHTLTIHLKVALAPGYDGIDIDDLLLLVRQVARHPHIELAGVFADLLMTGDPEQVAAIMTHRETFARLLIAIRAAGIEVPHAHLSTFADVMYYRRDKRFNTVRLGVMALGISPFPLLQFPTQMKRVITWQTHIEAIHTYKQGQTVGFNRRITLNQTKRLAHVAAGYTDGLHYNWGNLTLDGKRARLIGGVGPYHALIDVTDLPAVHPGDAVHLIDTSGNTVEAVALRLRNDPVRVLLSIPSRVPRKYLA